MTTEEVLEIIGQRFGEWVPLLAGEHATPAIVLGIGHDHRSGKLVVCALDDISPAQMAVLLRMAIDNLDVERFGLGATGKFPLGHQGDDDQGGLRAAIAADAKTGRVRINFGKPVSWLALSPQEARLLAENLRKKSYQAEGKK